MESRYDAEIRQLMRREDCSESEAEDRYDDYYGDVTIEDCAVDPDMLTWAKSMIRITALRREIAARKDEPCPEEPILEVRKLIWRGNERELDAADQIIAGLETEKKLLTK